MSVSLSQNSKKLRHARWLEGLLLFVFVASFFAYGRRQGDLANYVSVGNAVLDGRDIYLDTPPGANTWPPFFSFASVPLALLNRISPYSVRAIWIALTWTSIFWALDVMARMIYGKRLAWRANENALGVTSPEIFAPFLLTLPYLLNNLELLQINSILFALVLWGLYEQSHGREAAGGIAIAVAAVAKVMAIAFLPYLLYRKRWRAALWLSGAALVLFFSPMLALGWAKFWKDVALWPGVLRGSWGSGNTQQSVYSMWDRILGYHYIPFAIRGTDDIPMSGAHNAKMAWEITCAALGAIGLWACRGEPRPDSRWAEVEWAIVFVAATILSPLTRKPYLVVLLLPNALLYAAWRSAKAGSRERRILWWVMFSSFALSLPTLHDVIGKNLAVRLEMGSVVTYGTLTMLGGLLWYRSRAPRIELS